MGKITVNGIAKKEFDCDIMIISLNFISRNQNTGKAIESSMSECDQFLEYLKKQGMNISDIRLNDNGVSRDNYSDNPHTEANREIKLRVPFNMKFLNGITEVIKEFKFDIDMEVSYELSDLNRIHNQLIKDAIDDSRKKAEMVAEAMGKVLVGIDNINVEKGYNRRCFDEGEEMYRNLYCSIRERNSISNELKAPVCVETETVETVWIID